MTSDQQKYLSYLIMLKEFKESYKKWVMGFEHKGELDWKTYEQWRDEVIESFPEEGLQVGKYRATIHTSDVEIQRGNNVYVLTPRRKSIVLHKFTKGEKQ